jgi:16S rRNA (guanine527-N7)-methyltransferase
MGVATIEKYFADLTLSQKSQLTALELLYKEWNEKINVISRKDIDGLYLKHVLHSLSLAAVFEFMPGMQVIDIGCGGGFPLVPLAIIFPDTHFLGVDSINKKLTVVKEVCLGAGITNVSTLHSRAESIANRTFDVAISRAVAPLKDLLQWSKHLLRKPSEVVNQFAPSLDTNLNIATSLICLKGGDLTREIHECGRNLKVWEIEKLFDEDYFKEKYILQVR